LKEIFDHLYIAPRREAKSGNYLIVKKNLFSDGHYF
jgi:hypothetical protein